MNRVVAALALVLLVTPACVTGQTTLPATEPVPVKDILFALPFKVSTPYLNTWTKERPRESSGTLVVLEVDRALVDRRDTVVKPVLYAGDVPVIRLNHGDESGRVIGIIPGDIDLATAPIWFGSREFPARVTRETARAERERAEKAGIRPLDEKRLASVQREPVSVPDLGALLRDVAAKLVEEYSPQEKELADTWRLPEAKRAQ